MEKKKVPLLKKMRKEKMFVIHVTKVVLFKQARTGFSFNPFFFSKQIKIPSMWTEKGQNIGWMFFIKRGSSILDVSFMKWVLDRRRFKIRKHLTSYTRIP